MDNNNNKVLLLGSLVGKQDEGIRNISAHLYNNLKNKYLIKIIKPTRLSHFIEIVKFKPNIIHSLRGPSFKTLFLLHFLRIIIRPTKIFCSLLHPSDSIGRSKILIRYFKSITFFSQDEILEKKLLKLGFNVYYIPNGVDFKKYNISIIKTLPDEIQKQIEPNKKYLLHIGHLKRSRGLDIVNKILQSTNWGVIIIISERFDYDKEIYSKLIKSGAIIYIGHVENLAGIYSFSDYYFFPVIDLRGCIDMPLTVLESSACGTPVITTSYKALNRYRDSFDGITFYDSTEELIQILNNVNKKNQQTYGFPEIYNWEMISNLISEKYLE